jgi:hypothetical protein
MVQIAEALPLDRCLMANLQCVGVRDIVENQELTEMADPLDVLSPLWPE